MITEQLLTFDEIDEKPVLRFEIPIGNETVNGWIEIETINDEHYKDVILAIHADTTAALDLTEFFDSAILDGISKYPDGTRRFECNRKVAYAFFKMIMEKPVLQCGIDESEESPVEFGKKEDALLLTALMGVLNTERLMGFCGSDAEFEKLKSRGYIEPEPQDCWGVSKSGFEHLIESMQNGNVKSKINNLELQNEYLRVVELYEELNATPKPLTHTLTEIDKAILKSIKIGERSLDSIQCNWDVNRLEGLNRLDTKKKDTYIKARLSQLKADG